ncbi:MAG: hypothetical protein Q9199_006169 [Rusavskia elegans]
MQNNVVEDHDTNVVVVGSCSIDPVLESFAMSSDAPSEIRPDLTESSLTVPSDSENYSSSNNELSPSPPSSSSSPLILYSPPTFWGLLRGAAINLLLPFVNGLMLGFGELLAHEAAFRFGWSGTKVCCQTTHQPVPLQLAIDSCCFMSYFLRL